MTLLPEIDSLFFKRLYIKRDIKHSPPLQPDFFFFSLFLIFFFFFFINLIQSAPLADRVSRGQMDELLKGAFRANCQS